MKILHVTPYYPPDRIGGVGEIVRHLHEGLVARGHDSQVLTAGTSADDPRVHRIGKSALGFVLTVWRGLHLSRDRDVVHFQHGEALLLLLLMKLLRVRAKVLLTIHVDSWKNGKAYAPTSLGPSPRKTGLLGRVARSLNALAHVVVDRLANRLADHTSFISQSAARDFLGENPGVTPTVIYNGLPGIPSESRLPEVPKADLLYVGLFSTRKRTDLLPLILQATREARPQTTLRLVGAKPEDDPLLADSFRELGLSEAVIWEGRKRSEEIHQFYRVAGVLLVPSAYEGLPTVILEAMQWGVPCVATLVSGHPEAIEEGVNGFLVDLDDPGAMAAKALVILEDPGLRDRMSAAAWEVVTERFGLERAVSEYEELYQELVS